MNILDELAESYTYNGAVSMKAIEDDIVTLQNQIDSYNATLREITVRRKNPAPINEKIREANIRLSLLKALEKREKEKDNGDTAIMEVLGLSGKIAKETETPENITDDKKPVQQNFLSGEAEKETTEPDIILEEIKPEQETTEEEVVIEAKNDCDYQDCCTLTTETEEQRQFYNEKMGLTKTEPQEKEIDYQTITVKGKNPYSEDDLRGGYNVKMDEGVLEEAIQKLDSEKLQETAATEPEQEVATDKEVPKKENEDRNPKTPLMKMENVEEKEEDSVTMEKDDDKTITYNVTTLKVETEERPLKWIKIGNKIVDCDHFQREDPSDVEVFCLPEDEAKLTKEEKELLVSALEERMTENARTSIMAEAESKDVDYLCKNPFYEEEVWIKTLVDLFEVTGTQNSPNVTTWFDYKKKEVTFLFSDLQDYSLFLRLLTDFNKRRNPLKGLFKKNSKNIFIYVTRNVEKDGVTAIQLTKCKLVNICDDAYTSDYRKNFKWNATFKYKDLLIF